MPPMRLLKFALFAASVPALSTMADDFVFEVNYDGAKIPAWPLPDPLED